MKFHDNSSKMNISIFVIMSLLIAYYNCDIIPKSNNNHNNKSSFLELTTDNFLSSEESKKEMSEDMQFQNFFVIK